MSLHIHLFQVPVLFLHVDKYLLHLHKSYEVQGSHEVQSHIGRSQNLMSSFSGYPVRCLTSLLPP